MVATRAFGRSPRTVIFADGFVFGATDEYEIELWNPAGQLVRLIRKEQPVQPVTDAMKEAERRRRLEDIDDPGMRDRFAQNLADMPFAETLPAHGVLHVDRLGYLWVSEYRAPGDTVPRWTLFTPEGAMLGLVETPPNFDVYEIGSDYVLGRWRDEFDVEYVRLYALTGRSED